MSSSVDDINLERLLGETEDLQKEAQRIENDQSRQAYVFKNKLFRWILTLTVASFVFLIILVVFKVVWKIRHPEYDVISDTVINVLAVGVFAELVGVVGIIAKQLWQK